MMQEYDERDDEQPDEERCEHPEREREGNVWYCLEEAD